jgi:Rad3-related DNA helicase
MNQQLKKTIEQVIKSPLYRVSLDSRVETEGLLGYGYISMKDEGEELVTVCIDMLHNLPEITLYHLTNRYQFNRLGYRVQEAQDHVTKLKELIQTFANLNGWPPVTFED